MPRIQCLFFVFYTQPITSEDSVFLNPYRTGYGGWGVFCKVFIMYEDSISSNFIMCFYVSLLKSHFQILGHG